MGPKGPDTSAAGEAGGDLGDPARRGHPTELSGALRIGGPRRWRDADIARAEDYAHLHPVDPVSRRAAIQATGRLLNPDPPPGPEPGKQEAKPPEVCTDSITRWRRRPPPTPACAAESSRRFVGRTSIFTRVSCGWSTPGIAAPASSHPSRARVSGWYRFPDAFAASSSNTSCAREPAIAGLPSRSPRSDPLTRRTYFALPTAFGSTQR